MSEQVDFLIVGAGVVGLAVARELSSDKVSVVVAEQHDSFGRETSSRNSEVIHGGMYYPRDSLKCRLCIEGRRLLYEYARRNSIGHARTGKLIVATDEQEEQGLVALYEQGMANGVEGLRMLTSAQTIALEPEVRAVCSLFSGETGIIDSHAYMQCLLEEARQRGALCVFNTKVLAVQQRSDGYLVELRSAGQLQQLYCRHIVNSAGLNSDEVASLLGLDPDTHGYRLHYCKGSYFRLGASAAKRVGRLVYPVPKPSSAGLGVHVTVDLNGGARLGPDDEYLPDRSQDYWVNPDKAEVFYRSVSRFLPFVRLQDLGADTSGIRPKLQPKGAGFRDFVIKDEADAGRAGFINLIGIESPGLTASLAIARMVRMLCRG